MSGITFAMIPSMSRGNIAGIIFSIRASPPGTYFIDFIIGFMPGGIASIICGKIRSISAAMFAGSISTMNFSK